MDVSEDLKKVDPQKYFLKIICRLIYYMGMGDCWYEKTERSKFHKTVYSVWAVVINGYIILNTLNELLANFRSDLTSNEKNNLIQFSMAHPLLCAKYIFLVFQRKRCRVLFKRMVDRNSSSCRSLRIERKSVREAIWYFIGISSVSYGTLLMTSVDAFTAYKREGEIMLR